jgi:dihydroorotate dehydrogenase
MLYKYIFRPFLFLVNPERIHEIIVALLKITHSIGFGRFLLKKLYHYENPHLPKQVMGLHFPNPVGLAAGFDKNALLIDEMQSLGFGFTEIGTITPRPQSGNPKPRLFRLSADHALINRMGFNNEGLLFALQRLKNRKTTIIVGGNIGKNKTTPNEEAAQDYLQCFEVLHPVVDYFVVNVSSPNTPNLRELQEKEPLTKLLQTLQETKLQKDKPKPILLKIAPDLSTAQLDEIIQIVKQVKIEGVIATNTTIVRENLQTEALALEKIGAGGLSGKPLSAKSTDIIRYLRQGLGKKATIIGVGGIFSPEDALDKLTAGADLVQVYTGFVYEGASLVTKINKYLAKHYARPSTT